MVLGNPSLFASGSSSTYGTTAAPQTVTDLNPALALNNGSSGSRASITLRAVQDKAKLPSFKGVTRIFRSFTHRTSSQSDQDSPRPLTAILKDGLSSMRRTPSSLMRPEPTINIRSRDQERVVDEPMPGTFSRKAFGDDNGELADPEPEPDFSEVFLFSGTQDVNDDERDLVNEIPGFFRVLDLITERGSGGLVDKVLIYQDGLKNLINNLCPGAYTTLTKVDFKALDTVSVHPIGIYGDKSEIIRFFRSLDVINSQVQSLIENSSNGSMGPVLRSGIYAVRDPRSPDILYVVYWPQDTTWMDDAPSGPRRNRTTFMRYLTKMCDQILCLMSSAQSKAFVWDDQEQESNEISVFDFTGAGQDRLYTFEITTTNEQKEDVVFRRGFLVSSKLMVLPEHSDASLAPRLMTGETDQAFLSMRFIPQRTEQKSSHEQYTPMKLQRVLASSIIKIGCSLTNRHVEALIMHGLNHNYPDICRDWLNRQKDLPKMVEKQQYNQKTELRKKFREEQHEFGKRVFSFLINQVLDQYPMLDPQPLIGPYSINCEELRQLKDDMGDFVKKTQIEQLHPHLLLDFTDRVLELPIEFHEQMRRIVCVSLVYEEYQDYYNDDFAKMVIQKGPPDTLGREKNTVSTLLAVLPFHDSDNSDIDLKAEVDQRLEKLTAGDFLVRIDQFVRSSRFVEPAAQEALKVIYRHLSTALAKAFGALMPLALRRQEEIAFEKLDRRLDALRRDEQTVSINTFIQQINSMSFDGPDGKNLPILTLTQFDCRAWGGSFSFDLKVQQEVQIPPGLEFKINRLEVLDDHRHQLQLDPSFVPTPSINGNRSVTFMTSPRHHILHAQFLRGDKILVIIDNKRDCFRCYLEDSLQIGLAMAQYREKRKIQKDKVGQNLLVGVDETQRLLVLCAPQKLVLHVYVFDEQFTSLQSMANPFELLAWYDEPVTIEHMCCVTGAEEVLLVDSNLQTRVYSLVSQRFRPASISLPRMPLAVMSSPDGACALLLFQGETERYLVAYHWATFGATDGITIPLPEDHGSVSVTSFVHRQSVHLMMMNEKAGHCRSLALDITKKSSEYMFKEKGKRVGTDMIQGRNNVNNCLIDCFKDVWTRFPVVAAISRQTFGPSTQRQPKSITFCSDQTYGKYASYFADLARSFEEETKKPTGGQLAATLIDSRTSSEMAEMFTGGSVDFASQFPAGQWLVDLLCLLPIHIAVARENRFIPLKDGIASVNYERSLLGAEVRQIVDSLSFGWYESILQSYMVDKPVKVVSSMGEQSVGKSYSLNHLMDTSFAGSAMRTTEGVWMSITPTDDALLVALDFEGVHSIERSPQEDALLVLFNTAISNLVLFRNNFALSREITNLFQSFQASSSILDPASNPSLFRSTLVIIIKDVVESDQREIVREFSSKFQRMVQEEQETNFISKLHAGKLSIIPWPVIESGQFYSLFTALKNALTSQEISHASAGEFLYTLKTLMAKLKANDWGAMSQSLAVHRAQALLDILPTALEYGMAELEPNLEPLKNLDNNSVIDHHDTPLRLFLARSPSERQTDDRESVLLTLQKSWVRYGARRVTDEGTWIHELEEHLTDIVKRRVDHVEAWITSNLKRFKSARASLESVRREMLNAVVDLQTNIELCKFNCSYCNLSCTLSRKHDPSQVAHDCGTDHQCSLPCDYAEDHQGETKFCRAPAGHDGPHVCNVNEHLCGKDCAHRNRKGCQGGCTKMVGHDGEHMCPARKHACGAPCTLQTRKKHKGTVFTCPGTCDFPCDETHSQHICSNRMCPLSCELCERLCASTNHLHGLNTKAVHLCGESHRCQALCSSNGICQIDTTPQSVEATFVGRHETFQYTKYTQVSKRLPCVKSIPVGESEHSGPHIHSLDPSPFHFCETQCDNCGYFCTLPRGHTQQEHETSHGSMSRTKWVVDHKEGKEATIELNGHRFASRDDGAPMMCNLVCQSMGRHAHIQPCRTPSGMACIGPNHEHITGPLASDSPHAKDWITHALYWRRSGFKDPYSRDDQINFAKCDSMCSGSEHSATPTSAAQPSFCTLPIFHRPYKHPLKPGVGYVSHDGHLFSCKNPVVEPPAFHIIFVIDRSSSMSSVPLRPLHSTPWTQYISGTHNNRLGAVYLSLQEFWRTRQIALTNSGSSIAVSQRRDAYSIILFNNNVVQCVDNDFTSSPEQLLATVLQHGPSHGTNYQVAIEQAGATMRRNWSTERFPVLIFLSDGECKIEDSSIRTLCRSAISLGKPLSFHAVAFGPHNRVLRRMADIAGETERSTPEQSSRPPGALHVPSSYAEALDSVQLSETFLEIADSLRNPRGALMN